MRSKVKKLFLNRSIILEPTWSSSLIGEISINITTQYKGDQ